MTLQRGELKRAFVQVSYSVLSQLLFNGKGVHVCRVEEDHPGPEGYIQFVVYADDTAPIQRGEVYHLSLGTKKKK